MGYSLTIGELKSEIIGEGLESRLHNFAEDVKLPNAPAFGEPTDYMNCRWPSYTSWAQSMRTVGLYDFMYDKRIGLLRNHPGCVPLTKEDKEVFDLAYSEFYKNNPETKAEYGRGDLNASAVRLEWLKFWFDWAFENCKVPVFQNS